MTRDLKEALPVIEHQHRGRLTNEKLLSAVPLRNGKKFLDPCELHELLGRGASGVVYRTRHIRLGIDIAVWVLILIHGDLDSDTVARFQREARAAASIQSGNVVRVFDVLERPDNHSL